VISCAQSRFVGANKYDDLKNLLALESESAEAMVLVPVDSQFEAKRNNVNKFKSLLRLSLFISRKCKNKT
jgi:hypothetical protein